MYETTFDLVAQGLRYWFAALVVYILFRLIQSVLRDFSLERTEKKQAEGYSMGLLEVIAPADNRRLYGQRFALKRENRLGSAGKCDICLRDRSVASVQAMIVQRGNRVLLCDYGTHRGVYLNGQRIDEDTPLLDGDEIQLGNVLLLLHIKGGTAANRDRREQELAQQRAGQRAGYRSDRSEDEWETRIDPQEQDEAEEDQYTDWIAQKRQQVQQDLWTQEAVDEDDLEEEQYDEEDLYDDFVDGQYDDWYEEDQEDYDDVDDDEQDYLKHRPWGWRR